MDTQWKVYDNRVNITSPSKKEGSNDYAEIARESEKKTYLY